MFGFTLGLKGIAAASVAAFVFGGIVGTKVTSNYYKSGIYASKVKNLEKQIEARDSAVAKDTEQAIADRAEIERLKEANRELHSKIKDGGAIALTRDDVRWLRGAFWKTGQDRASARAGRSEGLSRIWRRSSSP